MTKDKKLLTVRLKKSIIGMTVIENPKDKKLISIAKKIMLQEIKENMIKEISKLKIKDLVFTIHEGFISIH